MEVNKIEADLFDCFNFFCHDYSDYQVLTEYVDPHNFDLIVRRLDATGWTENIKVLVCYSTKEKKTDLVQVGKCDKREKRIRITTDFFIEPGTRRVQDLMLPFYKLDPVPEPEKLSREEFNTMFETDIVVLPKDLYAVGINGGKIYMYNLYYAHYFEIIHSIRHVLSIMITFNITPKYYFIVSSSDGYMQNNYALKRTIPYYVSVNEYHNNGCVSIDDQTCYTDKGEYMTFCESYDIDHFEKLNMTEKEEYLYPVLHHKKWIFAQANKIGMPYTIDIIDRHYLYCNLYKPFRSFHCGEPFSKKINKMVYASRRDRGSKYNFLERRDIDMNPRDYFYTDAVCRDNIYCSEKDWIDSTVMRNYKYILDIDGNSCTWDATAWKLNSGSVILKTESRWRQWFYDDYLPWVHYVPIKDDFSNLQEMYQWCEENQDKCREIITNAKQLFQKTYRFHNVVKYTITLLDKLHETND
jgi:hypothetical protein